MAITCPECGREYDVTLFQLGRTIHCACGSRVGLEHRLTIPARPEGPRFIADAMLGRLARWLRTLGHDTAFADAIADEELVRRALEEGRHILTRDRRLLEEWRVGGGHLVESDATLEQLTEVVKAFDLAPRELFTRCRVCNGIIEPVAPEEVEGRIPDRIEEEGAELGICTACGRVYWEGSHTRRMRQVLAGIFERS